MTFNKNTPSIIYLKDDEIFTYGADFFIWCFDNLIKSRAKTPVGVV